MLKQAVISTKQEDEAGGLQAQGLPGLQSCSREDWATLHDATTKERLEIALSVRGLAKAGGNIGLFHSQYIKK